MPLAPRQRRSLESAHLARDLAALLGPDAADRRLIRLARLESTLLSVDRADATAGERIVASLTDPDGFSLEAVAEVLDEALARGMTEAAEAAATVIGAKAGGAEPAMPPSVRAAVVRAMDCGDLGVRFAAARTLAVAGPIGPYAGRSRMVETLLDCATSKGVVRAVVAHPDRFERQRLVSSVAALGYTPTDAVRGRDAVVAARESCDTRLPRGERHAFERPLRGIPERDEFGLRIRVDVAAR
ncbi:MAG: hypothetical protein EBU70_13425, partial [Actinobacteria bacterium]|nr:hypothetical protein [Actinomycetota bacterium]